MNPSSLARRGFPNRFLYGATSLPLMQRSRISPPSFNQSFHVVTVETDQGINRIRQCAELLIGNNAMRIGHLWQYMYRADLYGSALGGDGTSSTDTAYSAIRAFHQHLVKPVEHVGR